MLAARDSMARALGELDGFERVDIVDGLNAVEAANGTSPGAITECGMGSWLAFTVLELAIQLKGWSAQAGVIGRQSRAIMKIPST